MDNNLNESNHLMIMSKPASNWHEAMPTGNGTMGAMIFGSIYEETVMLNHEQLWYNGVDQELPNISGYLPELRNMLETGKYADANLFYPDLLRQAGYSGKNYAFQPAFDLKITTETNEAFKGYLKHWILRQERQRSHGRTRI